MRSKSLQKSMGGSLNNGHDDHNADEPTKMLSTMPNPPVAYENPYVTVKNALWFHTGINELVRIALYKMEKAFAYNSVFFLNAAMTTQLHYWALNISLPPLVKLEIRYVEKIAEILAVRLARRGKDNNSPSRELQLRTLVTALSLLNLQGWKMKSDAYAKLLDRLSERDYESHARYVSEGESLVLGSGDCEFLVRYACDLVRSMPNDYELRKIEKFGSQAVHFMIAEGLVNQSGGEPDLENMNRIYKRMTAPPSDWHEDLHHLAETVTNTINLEYQSKLSRNDMLPAVNPGSLPGNIPQIIIGRIQRELATMSLIGFHENPFRVHETRLFITALLDLLVQLVTAFPASEEAIESSEQLALSIITTSSDKELRLKALELIIASTTGCDEDEFYDAMRDLESYILKTAAQGTDVEILRFEKRAAMDKYGKKMILYTGAMESLHRRLQDRTLCGNIVTDRSITISPSWEKERMTVSPAPSGTILGGSIVSSPTSLFPSALKNHLFQHANNTQACAPPNSNPPEGLNGDQQRPIPNDIEPVIPENYERPGTSLSDYVQQDDNGPPNFRPLSFQRGAMEILQVPSQRRKKIQQQVPLSSTVEEEEEEEEEEIVTSTRVVESQTVPDTHPSEPYRERDRGSLIEVMLVTDLEAFRPPRKNRSKDITQAIIQTEQSRQKMSMDDVWQNGGNTGLSMRGRSRGDSVGRGNEGSKYGARMGHDTTVGLDMRRGDGDGQGGSIRRINRGMLDSVKEKVALDSAKLQSLEIDSSQTHPPQPHEDHVAPAANRVEERLPIGHKASFDLPIQGTSDEDFCLPKTIEESYDRRSAMSPIPVASELPDVSNYDTHIKNSIIRDGSDAPEVVEFSPEEKYFDTAMMNSEAKILKKKGSRASRLFSALPGSSVKGSRLSRFGSLRETIGNPLVLRKSQTGPEVRNEKMEILRRHANITYKSVPGSGDSSPNLSAEPPISPSILQITGGLTVSDYDSIASEHVYKLSPKDSNMVFLSLDCRHVVYMSTDGFQVFGVPTPHDPVPGKARYIYRLGEVEGLKKGKAPWVYKSGAASRRYIATLTKERIQIHDLQQACTAIYTKQTQDHVYQSIAIAADKLAVGMLPISGGPGEGVITIFKMRSTTSTSVQKWEEWKIIRLTVPSFGITDDDGAPYFLSLTRDGKGLTACTKSGHFFAWDITGRNEPVLLCSGRVVSQAGLYGAEVLTASFLFPDMKHILCSTMSVNDNDDGWGGCFTEPTRTSAQQAPHHPIRQVGLKIHHSAISPNGHATAFLSRTGRISVVPILHVEGDTNVTSTAASSAEQRLQASVTPETAGRIMFTPDGDKLISVDKKGKVIVLDFTKF